MLTSCSVTDQTQHWIIRICFAFRASRVLQTGRLAGGEERWVAALWSWSIIAYLTAPERIFFVITRKLSIAEAFVLSMQWETASKTRLRSDMKYELLFILRPRAYRTFSQLIVAYNRAHVNAIAEKRIAKSKLSLNLCSQPTSLAHISQWLKNAARAREKCCSTSASL